MYVNFYPFRSHFFSSLARRRQMEPNTYIVLSTTAKSCWGGTPESAESPFKKRIKSTCQSPSTHQGRLFQLFVPTLNQITKRWYLHSILKLLFRFSPYMNLCNTCHINGLYNEQSLNLRTLSYSRI